jgi:hypothetical protein
MHSTSNAYYNLFQKHSFFLNFCVKLGSEVINSVTSLEFVGVGVGATVSLLLQPVFAVFREL